MMIMKNEELNQELDQVENSDKDLYESPEGQIMTCSLVLTVGQKRNIHFLAALTIRGGS